ncbi:S-layer homology domain-containing protein [Arthrobacter sp. Sr33]
MVCALVVVAGTLIAPPPATSASAFSDVPLGTPFHSEITWLATQDISTGYPDGTFKPGQPVNRDAMAAFLYRLAGKPAFASPSQSRFADVPMGSQFFREIHWLASSGITTGWSDGTFRPLQPVKRDAMAAFLYRFAVSPQFAPPRAAAFGDVPVGVEFYKEISWLATTGISTGYPGDVFKPLQAVNRDAMAAFMYRTAPQLPPDHSLPLTPVTRDFRLYPFSTSAFSNTRVGPAIRFASASDPRHSTFRAGGTNVNSERWSISVQQASQSDPVATVRADAGGTHSIRIPLNATTTGGTDQHMSIIQPDARTAYEAWGMQRISATEWTARYLVKTDIRGEGMTAGARASGISHLHGLIRKDELKNLDINHSLAIGIDNAQLKSVNNGTGVWPARREDGDSARAYTGNIPMGSMLALPHGTNLGALGLSPEGYALAEALQQYGGHVLVRSSGVTLYAEPAANQTQVKALKNDWAKLRPLLRIVTNNTKDNIAGAR